MTTLNISFIIVIGILFVLLGTTIWQLYKGKRKFKKEDLFIIVGDDRNPKTRVILPATARRINIPSNQEYWASVYPDDRIIFKEKDIVIVGPDKTRIIRRTNVKNDAILTIKKGTQQPITRV